MEILGFFLQPGSILPNSSSFLLQHFLLYHHHQWVFAYVMEKVVCFVIRLGDEKFEKLFY
jgi:hypothetical protein